MSVEELDVDADPPAPSRDWSGRLRMGLLTGAGLLLLLAFAAQVFRPERDPASLPPTRVTSAPASQAPAVPATVTATAAAPTATATGTVAPAPPGPAPDPAWVRTAAARSGIPERALTAYAAADLIMDREQPQCGVSWNTIAAIGAVESAHGHDQGAKLGPDGRSTPQVLGVRLNGNGVARIPDTDKGVLDGDDAWDRAVGPMQFIPSTWADWSADGNADGVADPHQIDDAALATARYLCSTGPLTTPEGWRRAVFNYNHVDAYVAKVAAQANAYADATA